MHQNQVWEPFPMGYQMGLMVRKREKSAHKHFGFNSSKATHL